MAKKLVLHPDRLFPADPAIRAIARRLYGAVQNLPIISPHGHTDPAWFADDQPFSNAAELLLAPDHYLYRMLYSQGVPLANLGVPSRKGPSDADPREAWRLFARNFTLFRGTPSALWLSHVFSVVFGLDVVLDEKSADHYFDAIGAALRTDAFRPRALFERFNIEVLATTESPIDTLAQHRKIRESGWNGRVVTTYRPDAVVDPEHEQFPDALQKFGELTGRIAGVARRSPTWGRRLRITVIRQLVPQISVKQNAKASLRASLPAKQHPKTPSCSAHKCCSRWPA
jgi:glucuronate isomerase